MVYIGVAIILVILAVLILVLAARLLIGKWILQWLRGSAGLLLVGCAVMLGLAAWDLHSYHEAFAVRPIATLTFSSLGDKQFSVDLVDQSGHEHRYKLRGDFWELDVRVLKWADPLARLGLHPGYRLDRLEGRYLSLEDEQTLPHTVVDLRSGHPLFDVWAWLREINRYFPLIDARYGSAAYLPMADGALFSVGIGPSGVVAKPLNARAKLAVQQWQ